MLQKNVRRQTDGPTDQTCSPLSKMYKTTGIFEIRETFLSTEVSTMLPLSYGMGSKIRRRPPTLYTYIEIVVFSYSLTAKTSGYIITRIKNFREKAIPFRYTSCAEKNYKCVK